MTRAPQGRVRRFVGAAAAALAFVSSLTACGGDEPEARTGADAPSSSSGTSSQAPAPSESPSVTTPAGDPAPPDGKPFGPECRRFRTDGGVPPSEFADSMDFGTFTLLFRGEVGKAAAFMDRAGLWTVGERDGDRTYFLPDDDAIDVLNSQQLGSLLQDPDKAAETLGRHIVDGALPPSELAGEHETLSGGAPLQVAVDGAAVTVGLQGAHVLCGNIRLQDDVRVYVIDQLLIT